MDPIMVKTEEIREWSNEFRLIQPEAVRSMTTSMRSTGQLQPLILLKNDDGYHIIDGSSDTDRRWNWEYKSFNRWYSR